MENLDKKQCSTCGSSECKGCGQGQCGSCCGGMCSSMMGHGCHGGKRYLIQVILKIIILILVFWCGVKIGEMTGFIKASYGQKIEQNGFGSGMMRGGWGNYSNNSVTNPSGGTPTPGAAQ